MRNLVEKKDPVHGAGLISDNAKNENGKVVALN
jgi:hypothetical protein